MSLTSAKLIYFLLLSFFWATVKLQSKVWEVWKNIFSREACKNSKIAIISAPGPRTVKRNPFLESSFCMQFSFEEKKIPVRPKSPDLRPSWSRKAFNSFGWEKDPCPAEISGSKALVVKNNPDPWFWCEESSYPAEISRSGVVVVKSRRNQEHPRLLFLIWR